MNETLEPLWRLEQLAEQCQLVSQRLGLNSGESRRVSWDPSPRLLRYYTTLGMLDRAARMVGRTAYYNRRHLLQLLSIKHLQHLGKTLHEVQSELMGKSDAEHMALVGVGKDFPWHSPLDPPPPAQPPEHPLPSPSRGTEGGRRFWEVAELPEIESPTPICDQSHPALPHRQLLEISLGPGLTLTLDQNQYPQLDPNLVSVEFAPLLEALRKWRKP